MTDAQLELIEANMDLIKIMCHKYHGPQYDEVESVAKLALVEAAVEYDPSKGCAFRTYAVMKIKFAIADYFRSIDTMSVHHRRIYKQTGAIPQYPARTAKVHPHRIGQWDIGALRKGCWTGRI